MTTKNIHEATLAEVNDLGENSAEFVIKPLYYGYGNTLGNSLRRVLLSSVKGAAITSFSIEGVTHEFTSVPGVREDVVDIMLNLKNIRFKCHTDAPVELSLEIQGNQQSEKDGDKRVVAGDIKLTSDVEIANPNQTICHIDDPNTVLKMHFVVETGRGYLPIERVGIKFRDLKQHCQSIVIVKFGKISHNISRLPNPLLDTAPPVINLTCVRNRFF